MDEPKTKRLQSSQLCYSNAELRIPVKPSAGLLGGTEAAVIAAGSVTKSVRRCRQGAVDGQSLSICISSTLWRAGDSKLLWSVNNRSGRGSIATSRYLRLD